VVVPEIIPETESSVRPFGSVPDIENDVGLFVAVIVYEDGIPG
jgi:hypothetical protein